MPVIRASLLAVLALIGLALALDLARAQDPTIETATTLHPGLNLIGWTAEPTPTSQLFDEIPQLEAVWAWDAELDDWIIAARGAPEWLGGLGRLTPGMGLRMQLSGDQPYLWQRSTEPTRGLVKLRTGWNLVAWSGADQTPIDDALKGIGWSLRNVHRWNPTIQQWSIWTSPERTAQLIAADNTDQEADDDSETPTIRRGEALWINVARAVNWLQPTDILPRLVFPGGASQQLQTRVREDLEAVLNFYRTQYGIQADLDFTVYVAKDVDALIQAWKEDRVFHFERDTRAQWDRVGGGGWASSSRGIVIKQSAQDRYLLTHEYFHILQYQMAEVDGINRERPEWIFEGMAERAAGEHAVVDRNPPGRGLLQQRLPTITTDAPSLRSAERDNAQWKYTLGWLATDQLIADAGSDSWIEFWRQFASARIGPHHRWTSTPDWRTTFQNVFGQTVSEFYAAFDVWQRERAAANPATARSYDGNWIRGKVTDESGDPVAGAFVNAIRVEGETSVGRNQRAETNADGTFAVRAPEDGDYRLSVDINDDCTRYYRNGELVRQVETAGPIQVADASVRGVDIRLPPNACGWEIHGRVVGPNNELLTGVSISACDSRVTCSPDTSITSSNSMPDGSFVVTVAEPGKYHISAYLGHGCSVYFRSTARWSNASPITVAQAHISGILIRVPEGMCAHRISGRIVDSSGAPLSKKRFGAYWYGGGVTGWTEANGRFEILVPSDGAYEFNILQQCFSTLASQALGSRDNPIRVSGADVTGIVLRLPGTIEELCE